MMEWSLAAAHSGFAIAGLKQDGTLRALWAVGRPPMKAMEDMSAMRRRAFAAQSAIEKVKNKYCKAPHAHVKVVAVDPDAQGMGF